MKALNMKTTAALAIFGVAVSLNLTNVVLAQEKDPVVFKVNGQEVRASEISFAKDEILPHLGGLPAKARYPFLVDYLVERHLLAQAAVRDKINKTDAYRKRLRYYQVKALREAYFAEKIRPKITDEMIKATYEKEKSKSKTQKRAHARHILVASQKEADEIFAKINKGEDIAALAKAHSTDEVAAKGGDLGFFFAEEMVPEFSNVVFHLKKNQIGGPVKTKFGWHIVQLLDMRTVGPKRLEDVQEGIQAILLRQLVQDEIAKYKKQSKIEYLDPDLVKLRNQIQKRLDARQKALDEQEKKQAPQE